MSRTTHQVRCCNIRAGQPQEALAVAQPLRNRELLVLWQSEPAAEEGGGSNPGSGTEREALRHIWAPWHRENS